MEEILRQMQRMAEPSYLPTMTMSQLYDTVYESRVPIIDGLLYPGTYLFVGAPKVGKSFLMAQIAYHVSTGQALWNYPVHSGTVLYLALEDDYRRLQERLSRMFGVEGTDTLHFATCAKQLGWVQSCPQVRGLDARCGCSTSSTSSPLGPPQPLLVAWGSVLLPASP